MCSLSMSGRGNFRARFLLTRAREFEEEENGHAANDRDVRDVERRIDEFLRRNRSRIVDDREIDEVDHVAEAKTVDVISDGTTENRRQSGDRPTVRVFDVPEDREDD